MKHIPKDVMEEFSKRRAEIEQMLKLKAGSLDAASSKYAEMIAKETRRTKDTEKARSELLEGWQEIAATFGVTPAYLNAIREPRGRISRACLASAVLLRSAPSWPLIPSRIRWASSGSR